MIPRKEPNACYQKTGFDPGSVCYMSCDFGSLTSIALVKLSLHKQKPNNTLHSVGHWESLNEDMEDS